MTRRLLSALAILLVLGAVAEGKVSVRLLKPPPGKLFIEHLWRANLNNTDPDTHEASAS